MKWVVPYNSSVNRGKFFDDFDHFVDSFLTPVDSQNLSFQPVCDIDETNEHYLASFDLPGVKKEDINIEVKDNHLMITGERKKEFKDEKTGHYERSFGEFQRTFALPEKLDPQSVEASFEDGVLQVLVPKSTQKQSHRVTISDKKSGSVFGKILNSKQSETKES